MCVAIFAFKASPEFPLLILHNRDEFFERSSKPASWINSSLHGLDVQSNGTWFGINREGFCAFLTNRWSAENEKRKSRGGIVPRVLEINDFSAIEDFLRRTFHEYTPFNLVYGNVHQLFSFSSSQASVTPVEPGIHTISSSSIDERRYKTNKLRSLFDEVFSSEANEEDYFQILRDRSLPPEPDPHLAGVLPDEVARGVGAIFVNVPTYGTRTSTVLSVSKKGKVRFSEVIHDQPQSQQKIEYDI